MGVYHIYVNPKKEEFFDPGYFGDGIKYRALFQGFQIHIFKLLLYSTDLTTYPINERLVRWTGDPFFIAPDDIDADPLRMAEITGEETELNLYFYAYKHYRNISPELLAFFLTEYRKDEIIYELFESAKSSSSLFYEICQVYFATRNKKLEADLTSNFTENWLKKYTKITSSNQFRPYPV